MTASGTSMAAQTTGCVDDDQGDLSVMKENCQILSSIASDTISYSNWAPVGVVQ